jgi:hypothetical protein
MRCLDPVEFRDLLTGTRFKVGDDGLVLTDESIASSQGRIARGGLREGSALTFCKSAIRWLPEQSRRAIFITDAWSDVGDARFALSAMRIGLGEKRTWQVAPFHVTDAHTWTWDQVETTAGQAEDEGLLVGILSLILSCGWDAWLLADGCSDAIEFWEGNILFYSDDKRRLSEANVLLRKHRAAIRMG